MQILRHFVPEGTDPYSMFEFEEHHCLMQHHKTGKVLCDMKAEMPKKWSANARDIVISKYLRRAGVPKHLTPSSDKVYDGLPEWLVPCVQSIEYNNDLGSETSIKQTIHRIVGHWTYVGYTRGYFDPSREQFGSVPEALKKDIQIVKGEHDPDFNQLVVALREKNAKAFYDENVYVMLNQMAAPNSPQWFNTGLWWAYGITGKSQGQYKVMLPPDINRLEEVFGDVGNQLPVEQWNNIVVSKLVQETPDPYSNVQVSACFILGISDHLHAQDTQDGIVQWYSREALIFKYGSGSGLNASPLRGEGEPLNGGGKSSGLMSWVKVADYSAGAIKSGGTTRRAAKMVVLDMDHPDVLPFIRCKADSEVAVSSLVTGSKHTTEWANKLMAAVRSSNFDAEANIQQVYTHPAIAPLVLGAVEDHIPDATIDKAIRLSLFGEEGWVGKEYGTEFEDEAYTIAPYQNANHSVSIPNAFYDACDAAGDWSTTWRTSGKVAWTMKARDVEHEIAKATWFSGDPGAQYSGTINDWNVTPVDGMITASNPCSEHLRLPDSACNLASLNVGPFIKLDGTLDFVSFCHTAYLWQMVLDISVEMSHLPSRAIAMNVFNYRDTGLGYANLGASIMSLGLAYDSDEGRAFAGISTALLHSSALLCSAHLARELGAYPRFWANKEHHLRCVRNHYNLLVGQPTVGLRKPPPFHNQQSLGAAMGDFHAESLYARAKDNFEQAIACGEETGFRNAEATVIAPTGTISFAMDCETSGCEPMLALVVFKLLAGGGTMTMAPSKTVVAALQRLKYDESEIEGIVHYMTGKKDAEAQLTLRKLIRKEHWKVFDTALSRGFEISTEGHLKMMAAIQPFVSGAISKTVNMPNSGTIEDCRGAYRMAYDLGLKCVALFRDKSKLSQPLNLDAIVKTVDVVKDVRPMNEVEVVQEMKRVSPYVDPKSRMKMGWQRKQGVNICVGIGAGNLYLMTSHYDDGKIGEIWATYTADQGLIQALLSHVCKTANVGLQYGIPLTAIIRTWQDSVFEPRGLVHGHPYIKQSSSMLNLLARLLDYHVLGNTGLLQVQPSAEEKVQPPIGQPLPPRHPEESNPSSDEDKGSLTGRSCPQCGSQTIVPSGSNCEKCTNCGYAGGCG